MRKIAIAFMFVFVFTFSATNHLIFAATETVGMLNDLIHTSKDAQDGYYASAPQVQNPELKALFLALSKERSEFVNDLIQKVRDEGGTPSDRGTAEGAFYRGWIDVKTALTKNDDHAVLAEVIKAESVGLNRYEKALERKDISEAARVALQKQAEKIRSAKQLIEKLENATSSNLPVKDAIKSAKDSGIDTRVS